MIVQVGQNTTLLSADGKDYTWTETAKVVEALIRIVGADRVLAELTHHEKGQQQ